MQTSLSITPGAHIKSFPKVCFVSLHNSSLIFYSSDHQDEHAQHEMSEQALAFQIHKCMPKSPAVTVLSRHGALQAGAPSMLS